MKKVLVVLVASLLAVGAFAQTEKGKFRVGGNADLSFLNTKYDGADKSDNDFNFGANAGYFVIDNLAVEAGVGFGYSKDGAKDVSSTAYTLNIGARYYLPVKVFVGANFEFLGAKVGDADSATGTGLNLLAGYAIFLNDKVAIEPALGYRLGLGNKDKGTKFNQFGAQVGFSLFF